MKKIGMGVVGMGFGSILLSLNAQKRYAQEVRGNANPGDSGECAFEVRGIADAWKPAGAVAQLAKDFGVAHASNDYMKIVNLPDIDVVAVYVPDALHQQVCMAALNAGKHVVCTKPMTSSIEGAIEIVKKVEETGLKFLVGQTMRFEQPYASLKKMCEDGDLGKIVVAGAHYVHDMRPVYIETPWRLTMPQDFIYGGLIHPVDVLRWFCGDVQEVHALGNKGFLTEGRKSEYDNYLVNMKFKSGVIARVMACFDIVEPPLPMMQVDIMGTKGSATAEFTDFEPGVLKCKLDKLPAKNPWKIEFPPQTSGDRGLGNTVMKYIRHFQDALINDFEPVPSAREGAKSVAVCDAAIRSMKSGKVEKVRDDF
jgi:predicted dehydrogenase